VAKRRNLSGDWTGIEEGLNEEPPLLGLRVALYERVGELTGALVQNEAMAGRGRREADAMVDGRRSGGTVDFLVKFNEAVLTPKVFQGIVTADGEQIEGVVIDIYDANRRKFLLQRQPEKRIMQSERERVTIGADGSATPRPFWPTDP
jgi:hypothetical protein